jgi:hypothetical protein
VQHFGSALNCNVHIHSLLMDGVFVDEGPERELVFLEQQAPSQEEVVAICRTVAKRVTAHIEGKGQEELAQGDSLDIALGHALEVPRPRPRQSALGGETYEPPPHRCAQMEGYSLHANVAVAADDREALLRLVRYGARQSFSQEYLSLLEDGRIRYELKRPFGPCGACAIVLEPTELLHRLAALVPRPYLHLTRYHGTLAPNAARRHEVLPAAFSRRWRHRTCPGDPASSEELVMGLPPKAGPAPSPRIPWAELLRRTYGFDLESCPKCIKGTMAVIAYITEGKVVERILSHLGLPTGLPTPQPATRPSSFEELWPEQERLEEHWEVPEADEGDFGYRGRAPPD